MTRQMEDVREDLKPPSFQAPLFRPAVASLWGLSFLGPSCCLPSVPLAVLGVNDCESGV